MDKNNDEWRDKTKINWIFLKHHKTRAITKINLIHLMTKYATFSRKNTVKMMSAHLKIWILFAPLCVHTIIYTSEWWSIATFNSGYECFCRVVIWWWGVANANFLTIYNPLMQILTCHTLSSGVLNENCRLGM